MPWKLTLLTRFRALGAILILKPAVGQVMRGVTPNRARLPLALRRHPVSRGQSLDVLAGSSLQFARAPLLHCDGQRLVSAETAAVAHRPAEKRLDDFAGRLDLVQRD